MAEIIRLDSAALSGYVNQLKRDEAESFVLIYMTKGHVRIVGKWSSRIMAMGMVADALTAVGQD